MFARVSAYLDEEVINSLAVPIYDQVTVLRTIPFASVLQGQSRSSPSEDTPLYSLSDINKPINLIDGRLPEKAALNGVYESLVTERAMKERKMVLGSIYELYANQAKPRTILVKPVGVFNEKEGNDPYWFVNANEYTKGFVLDDLLFRQSF